MFDKILIANRGEIACRVMRTARRLGIRAATVFSEADSQALHVALADEAYLIGAAPAAESYLKIDAVIEAAKRCGAQAIHPGYGFLAENADFAEACAEAGVVFIGPPPEVLRAMGSKSGAKAIMEKAGVATLPGYHGEDQSPKRLRQAAEQIGYPLMVKAVKGGGGTGLRRVEDAAQLDEALAGAKREALSAFGDDELLIERYLPRPRHIEIQVFADAHGNALHLFERECTIQRRHQKVIEEAPAPGMGEEMRARMGRAALDAVRAIGYEGAGTVEFLVDAAEGLEQGAFHFIEMNTRLQVEHAVTEMVTYHDLVEWQLLVAAGEPLPLSQSDLMIDGHAIEARLYAEDPAHDFLPRAGRLHRLRLPEPSEHLRVECGVREGETVGIHYDPMIAKLIVWDEDRDSALRRLRDALGQVQIAGLATNVAFLAAIARHPAFARAELDTAFVDRHRSELAVGAAPVSDRVLALAALDVLLRRERDAAQVAARCDDPGSPWHLVTGWRLNGEGHDVLRFVRGGEEVAVSVRFRGEEYLLELPGGEIAARGELLDDGELRAELGGERVTAAVVHDDRDITVLIQGVSHVLGLYEARGEADASGAEESAVTAPLPGKVVQLMVDAGTQVKRGAALMIVEAMKMEHTIVAPADGEVMRFNYQPGEQVDEGAVLLAFEPVKLD